MKKLNAAGLDVRGKLNPNWKGGNILKVCQQCKKEYMVRPGYIKSKYCSLQCVGMSQKGVKVKALSTKIIKECDVCARQFEIFKAYEKRQKCCSKECSFKRRSRKMKGKSNVNWSGGVSRLPYPHNWISISRKIRKRDGNVCRNPLCDGQGKGKIEVHHIDYDKMNVDDKNLITLCTVCNTKANFNRDEKKRYYINLLKTIYPMLFATNG